MKISYDKIILIGYGISIFIIALQQSSILSEYNAINVCLRLILTLIIIAIIGLEIKRNGKVTYKSLPIYAVVLGTLIFNMIKNNLAYNLLFIVLFMFACRRIEPDKVFKTYSIGALLAILVTICAWKLGIVTDYISDGKYYLGFNYSTFGPNFFFHWCVAYVAWKKEKIHMLVWVFILLVNVWFYKMTDTTSVYMLVWITFVAYLILRIKKKTKKDKGTIVKFKEKVFPCLPFILAIFTIIIQFTYNQYYYLPIFEKANEMLSYRLALGKTAFSQYNITLIGQPVAWNSMNYTDGSYFYVDSSYLQILLTGGVVLLTLICGLMYIVCKRAVVKRDAYLYLALAIFLIHCIADPQLLSFRYNPFLIVVIYAFSDMKSKKQQLKKEESQELKMQGL